MSISLLSNINYESSQAFNFERDHIKSVDKTNANYANPEKYPDGFLVTCDDHNLYECVSKNGVKSWVKVGGSGSGAISVETSSSGSFVKRYTFKQDDNIIANIDIPKDLVVQNGTIQTFDSNQIIPLYDKYGIENNDDNVFYVEADSELSDGLKYFILDGTSVVFDGYIVAKGEGKFDVGEKEYTNPAKLSNDTYCTKTITKGTYIVLTIANQLEKLYISTTNLVPSGIIIESATDPSDSSSNIYYNTTDKTFKVNNGGTWSDLKMGSDAELTAEYNETAQKLTLSITNS